MKRLVFPGFIALLLLFLTRYSAESAILVSPPAQVLKVAHGAHLRPTIEYGQEVAAFSALVQKDLAVLMYFMDWQICGQNGVYFDPYLLDKIRQTYGNNGPVIMLTWQPLNGKTPGCQKNYSGVVPPADIIAGKCDNYILGFAQALKARPERILLRFAHEMNIQDAPWWPGHFGVNDASLYVQMWRHVYDVFSSQNVPNVEWVWSPNYESNPTKAWNNRNNYYPGNNYTDWVGVSGYNWNTPWMTFNTIYDSSLFNYVLDDFACRYPKPQILAEFGSVDGSGGKPGWISDAYLSIPQQPFVRAALWFNDYADANPSGADFRVTTSTAQSGSVKPLPSGSGAWTNAYKQAIADSVYATRLPSLAEATPPTTYCGNGDPVYQAIPNSVTIDMLTPSLHQVIGMMYVQDQVLSLRVPPGSYLVGTFLPNSLLAPWGKVTLSISASPSTPVGAYDVFVQGNGNDLVTIRVNVQAPPNIRFYLPLVVKN